MIDHEDYIFKVVASKLREEYGIDNIYIIGKEISDVPPKFPAVSIIMSDNIVNERYTTFSSIENVAIESYKVEAVSILDEGKKECKKIIDIVNTGMEENGYVRTFSQPVPGTNSRRVARFKKNNSI